MGQMPKGACSAGQEKADRYHICRRSLRMWPLDANDLQSSLGSYLLGKLGLSQEDVNGIGQIMYKKCHARTASKIKKEFIVTFESSEARDLVRAAAYNLTGEPGWGMRLHIPGHPEPNFKVLENLSYLLKKKHQSLRRNIKFDEPNMDLMLDFQVRDGEPRRTVRPEQAKKYANSPRNESTFSADSRDCTADDLSDILGDPPEVPQ